MDTQQLEKLNRQITSASVSAVLSGEFDKNEVLFGYQKRWIEDDSVFKVCEKSRRTGITWAEAADAALNGSMSQEAGGCNTFYVGSNKDMSREFIDACAMWSKAYGLAASEIAEETIVDDDKKDILTFVIYFTSGYKIQALSSNPKNLRGMQGNVIIDEAAHHDDLKALIKAASPLRMWGGKIRVISTHNGNENLFYELIEDIRKGKRKGSVHTITLDDACRDGLYQRICQVTRKQWSAANEDEWKRDLLTSCATEDDALEEYYCVPQNGAGAYIPFVLIERAANDSHYIARFTMPRGHMQWTEDERKRVVLEFCETELKPALARLNPEKRHAYGQDFARSGDLSVIGVGSIEQDTRRALEVTIELRDVPYNQQRQIAIYVIEHTPRLVGIATDSTGNGGYLGEALLLRYGDSLVDAIHITDSFYREWSPKYKSLYESGYISIPRDEDIIADQRKIQNIRGIPKIDKAKNKGKDGKQRHGDSAGAYLMFTRASYMEGYASDGFIGLPTRHAANDGDDDDHQFAERGCI